MFDIGFSEIVVIGVVALIVIGPEKLPKTARTLGHLFGRLQRYVTDVKADITREIELDELRKLQQEVNTAAKALETSVTSAVSEVESGVRNVESELNAAAGAGAGTPDATAASAPQMLPLPEAEAAAQPPVSAAEPVHASVSAPAPEPASPAPAADAPAPAAAPAEPVRQASLPGFERG
jgi:sec-independent protein translocase protein TatB